MKVAEACYCSLHNAAVREELPVRRVTKIFEQLEEQLENDNSLQI